MIAFLSSNRFTLLCLLLLASGSVAYYLFPIPGRIVFVALPTLLLVIGIADGVHIYEHYNQRLIAGVPPRRAVTETFVKLGSACLLTSITTAIGVGANCPQLDGR